MCQLPSAMDACQTRKKEQRVDANGNMAILAYQRLAQPNLLLFPSRLLWTRSPPRRA